MSDIKLLEKIKNYNKNCCYQYQKRIDTFANDLNEYGWSEQFVENISIDDFEFSFIESTQDKKRQRNL